MIISSLGRPKELELAKVDLTTAKPVEGLRKVILSTTACIIVSLLSSNLIYG